MPTVDDGKVTAVAEGTAVIYYTVYNGYGVPHTESCNVTVTETKVSVESIQLNNTDIACEVGDEIQLEATVLPDNATVKDVVWSSNDENVATVSETGLVKILIEGTCVITATSSDDSSIKAECQIHATSDVDTIFGDDSAIVDVYTLDGVAIAKNVSKTDLKTIPAGLYIVRQGATTRKIAVK